MLFPWREFGAVSRRGLVSPHAKSNAQSIALLPPLRGDARSNLVS